MLKKMRTIKLKLLVLFIALVFSGCDSDNSLETRLKSYEESLKEDPRNCFYAEQVASIYQFKGQYSLAIEHFKIAVENCPNDPMVKFQMGVVYQLLNNIERADSLMNDALLQAKAQGDSELEKVLADELKFWRSQRSNLDTY